MEDVTRRVGASDLNLASRRAEEAALRKYQAVHWLDYLIGPLGISSQPSEKEFISCLRSGIVLCKLINKVQAGSVQKVVENISPSPSLTWDSQPLPAYQCFENVTNFLKAVEKLKLPVFEASVLERDNLEEGSSAKVVDCILALKDYHEWKQMTGGNGVYKPPRSPLVVHSAGRICPVIVSRRLDMSAVSSHETEKLEDIIVQKLVEHMLDTKENVDNELVASYHAGNVDSINFFSKILSSCLEEKLSRTNSELKSSVHGHLMIEKDGLPLQSPHSDLTNLKKHKCCRACLEKGSCNHWDLLEQQERDLSKIKLLLTSAKQEVGILQSQLQYDLKQIGDQVLEMSSAALGYHNAVIENRNLYNMVQDLKGSIRVYCRIRPLFNPKSQNVIDCNGEDASLVIAATNLKKNGKKIFQFNRVFGPTSTQEDVFRDTRALIRSVMDGYNVCIFAYGQTGSGKTYTMSGPPAGSAKELGISYFALNDLFELSEQRKDVTKYKIQVQMVEIYNEQVRDLLTEDSSTTKLEIRSSLNGLALPDATLRPVKSTEDVISLIKLGAVNRSIGSTAFNIQSSRSHSILSVHVRGEDVSGNILRSCLHLVDLAGSERVDKSETTGDGPTEAQHINKSLSCLVDVITALAQKSSHVPYKNSTLTLLLQNSLGGSAKTLMFAHVNPEGDYYGETMSTLKFAQRVSTVELGASRANKVSNEVLELKSQIESLKKTLSNECLHTPSTKRTKVAAKSPIGNKPKQQTVDQTPPQPRRLSIDNDSIPPVQRSVDYPKGQKTPSVAIKQPSSVVKPKQVNEKTPPQHRRLSIENCGSKPMVNYGHSKRGAQTPSTKARSRRLSLEGPQNAQKVACSQILGTVEEDERSITRQFNGVSRSLLDLTNHIDAPTSPIKVSMVKIDTARTKIPSFQTPEPEVKLKSELLNDHKVASEIQTPAPTTTHGKGSQLKKSLRTIGKLINGSEKRNQKKHMEIKTPIHDGGKSPVSTMRRQSLTSTQPEKSRRSSLGGVSNDSYANENGNAQTPPQVRASVKLTKRWL